MKAATQVAAMRNEPSAIHDAVVHEVGAGRPMACNAPLATHGVPRQLASKKLWLLWRRIRKAGEKRDGKLPFYVSGLPRSGAQGSDQDRAQLASYEEALAALHTGGFDGIGLAILPDAEIVALDFDDVVEDGEVDPRVLELVAGTYAELSPSGRGVRAFFEGTLPSRKDVNERSSKAKGESFFKAEVFGTSGFVTFTGVALKQCAASGCTDVAPLPPVVLEFFRQRWSESTEASCDQSELLSISPKLGLALDEAKELVMLLSADCGYDEWWQVGAALHHEFDGGSEAFGIFQDWSLTGSRPASLPELQQKWKSFGRQSGSPLTMASVRRRAQEALAALAPADIIHLLRRMPKDDVLRRWAELASHLGKLDADEVMDEVARLTGKGARALRAYAAEVKRAEEQRRQVDAQARRTGGRKVIAYRPEDQTKQALEVEKEILAAAKPGEYVAFAGMLSQVLTKPLPYTHLLNDPDRAPPPVTHLEPMDEVAVLAQVERVVAFEAEGKSGRRLISVPQPIIEILLKKKRHQAPQVNGLVPHPIVLHDGRILHTDGYDQRSGLFLTLAELGSVRAYDASEAVEALRRIEGVLLEGFEFEQRLDATVALAALFTGVERRILDKAPGWAVLASNQASGKTTLARRIHIVLTGQDMPASSFPLGDEAEARKCLLSMLLRSPSMVCFDNIPDGYTFHSGALAAAMTSSSMHQRILGLSREAECSTNVLFVLTGNNLTLGADEVTRWMVTRLAPKTARPEERSFSHPDVLAHGLRHRKDVLRDVVGIIAGYQASGVRVGTGSATRFPAWDRLVRQPLIWAGAGDVAEVFRTNAAESDELRAHRALMHVLRSIFGEDEFTAADVAQASSPLASFGRPVDQECRVKLRSALESLAVKDVSSSRSVGRVLASKVDRIAIIDDGPVEARVRKRMTRDNSLLYRIEVKRGD